MNDEEALFAAYSLLCGLEHAGRLVLRYEREQMDKLRKHLAPKIAERNAALRELVNSAVTVN